MSLLKKLIHVQETISPLGFRELPSVLARQSVCSVHLRSLYGARPERLDPTQIQNVVQGVVIAFRDFGRGGRTPGEQILVGCVLIEIILQILLSPLLVWEAHGTHPRRSLIRAVARLCNNCAKNFSSCLRLRKEGIDVTCIMGADV
jgi:hypothetical protein